MPMPRIETVEGRPRQRRRAVLLPVITGDYSGTPAWGPRPVTGSKVEKPTPIFTKLDPAVVDEELARLSRKRLLR